MKVKIFTDGYFVGVAKVNSETAKELAKAGFVLEMVKEER